MTLTEWLDAFRVGAARLPGWQLLDGKLRRQCGTIAWSCPLQAQWNFIQPQDRCRTSAPIELMRVWWQTLEGNDLRRLVDAADGPSSLSLPCDHALRAQLLAACGVEEN